MPRKTISNYRFILAVALLLFTVRIVLSTRLTSATDITPNSVASAVNSERTQRNIPALTANSKLAAAADYKAQDMISRNYFSHVDPDGHYIWDKITAEGYTPYTVLGENLAIDFFNVEGLMSAWIDSPTHRANILNPAFRDQGVGVASGNGTGFSIAIANTFGAQPVLSAPAQKKQQTAPAPKPAQTSPTTAPKPIPQAAAVNTLDVNAPLKVARQSVQITPTIKNNSLDIHVFAQAYGNISSMTATVNGNSIELAPTLNGFAGDIVFDKYFNYQQSDLVLEAADAKGFQNSLSIPLESYPLPADQNPKSFGDFPQKASQPDLYNVFKYIVIAFGVLFVLIMLGDALHLRKSDFSDLDKLRIGSNVVLLFLVLSTLLLVSWWQ